MFMISTEVIMASKRTETMRMLSPILVMNHLPFISFSRRVSLVMTINTYRHKTLNGSGNDPIDPLHGLHHGNSANKSPNVRFKSSNVRFHVHVGLRAVMSMSTLCTDSEQDSLQWKLNQPSVHQWCCMDIVHRRENAVEGIKKLSLSLQSIHFERWWRRGKAGCPHWRMKPHLWRGYHPWKNFNTENIQGWPSNQSQHRSSAGQPVQTRWFAAKMIWLVWCVPSTSKASGTYPSAAYSVKEMKSKPDQE